MEYRRLGTSDLSVSPICLGAMTFGGRTGAAVAGRIVGSARDAGINFIDTADVYSQGRSERLVGKLIKGERQNWVVASKVGFQMGKGFGRKGLGRKWLVKAAEGSLRRLGSDYLDVYYLHLDDPQTPIEETVGAIGGLIDSGKVRHWGFSNYRAWRIAEMMGTCDASGVPHPVVGQPYYNAMNRMPEMEYIPACVHFGAAVVPYSPLARGVLTGKYRPGKAPARSSRAGRKDKRILETEFRRESLLLARKIKAHAERRGMTAGQFALLWVLNNAYVTSALAGPRTYSQWREYLGALDHSFTAGDEALIDRLVAPGHPSSPGYTDPKYPVEGRVARG